MNEREIIGSLAAHCLRSKDQLNGLFECDAELVKIGDRIWGMTMDDFSPAEDLFSSASPGDLGANLVVATLSDLLAAGVEPQFFMHAVSLPRDVTPSFVAGLSAGIESVLRKAGCALYGGDVGTSEDWRYCGFAMGPVVSPFPLTHRIPTEPQTLWVTGELGDANLAAFQQGPTPSFQLRLQEAGAIRQYATACIDTSGGFMDAVWLLHDINPKMRFEVDVESLPLAPGVREFSKKAGIPAGAALLGGAGEYELLFTTGRTSSASDVLPGLGITPVGTVEPAKTGGVHICRQSKAVSVMTSPPPCPRSVPNVTDHVKSVIEAACSLFGR